MAMLKFLSDVTWARLRREAIRPAGFVVDGFAFVCGSLAALVLALDGAFRQSGLWAESIKQLTGYNFLFGIPALNYPIFTWLLISVAALTVFVKAIIMFSCPKELKDYPKHDRVSLALNSEIEIYRHLKEEVVQPQLAQLAREAALLIGRDNKIVEQKLLKNLEETAPKGESKRIEELRKLHLRWPDINKSTPVLRYLLRCFLTAGYLGYILIIGWTAVFAVNKFIAHFSDMTVS
jgi:hypothetical protein